MGYLIDLLRGNKSIHSLIMIYNVCVGYRMMHAKKFYGSLKTEILTRSKSIQKEKLYDISTNSLIQIKFTV